MLLAVHFLEHKAYPHVTLRNAQSTPRFVPTTFVWV